MTLNDYKNRVYDGRVVYANFGNSYRAAEVRGKSQGNILLECTLASGRSVTELRRRQGVDLEPRKEVA